MLSCKQQLTSVKIHSITFKYFALFSFHAATHNFCYVPTSEALGNKIIMFFPILSVNQERVCKPLLEYVLFYLMCWESHLFWTHTLIFSENNVYRIFMIYLWQHNHMFYNSRTTLLSYFKLSEIFLHYSAKNYGENKTFIIIWSYSRFMWYWKWGL